MLCDATHDLDKEITRNEIERCLAGTRQLANSWLVVCHLSNMLSFIFVTRRFDLVGVKAYPKE